MNMYTLSIIIIGIHLQPNNYHLMFFFIYVIKKGVTYYTLAEFFLIYVLPRKHFFNIFIQIMKRTFQNVYTNPEERHIDVLN